MFGGRAAESLPLGKYGVHGRVYGRRVGDEVDAPQASVSVARIERLQQQQLLLLQQLLQHALHSRAGNGFEKPRSLGILKT